MNLTKKLRNFGIGLGIAGLSFLPIKAFGQEVPNSNYYSKLGISWKMMNNSNMQEYFKSVFGGKGSVGIKTGNISRIELEGAYYGEKNKEKDLRTKMAQIAGYYDVCFGKKDVSFYFGGGIKIMNFKFENLDSDYSEQLTGVGGGFRGGIELKSDNEMLYIEFNYDEINGRMDGENCDLSGAEITIGGRFKF